MPPRRVRHVGKCCTSGWCWDLTRRRRSRRERRRTRRESRLCGRRPGCSRTPTRKKSPTFKDRNPLLAAQAGGGDAATKRCSLEDRARDLREWPISENSESFLAKSRAGRMCLELVSRRTARRRAHYPFLSQMAKVELYGVLRTSRLKESRDRAVFHRGFIADSSRVHRRV